MRNAFVWINLPFLQNTLLPKKSAFGITGSLGEREEAGLARGPGSGMDALGESGREMSKS